MEALKLPLIEQDGCFDSLEDVVIARLIEENLAGLGSLKLMALMNRVHPMWHELDAETLRALNTPLKPISKLLQACLEKLAQERRDNLEKFLGDGDESLRDYLKFSAFRNIYEKKTAEFSEARSRLRLQGGGYSDKEDELERYQVVVRVNRTNGPYSTSSQVYAFPIAPPILSHNLRYYGELNVSGRLLFTQDSTVEDYGLYREHPLVALANFMYVQSNSHLPESPYAHLRSYNKATGNWQNAYFESSSNLGYEKLICSVRVSGGREKGLSFEVERHNYEVITKGYEGVITPTDQAFQQRLRQLGASLEGKDWQKILAIMMDGHKKAFEDTYVFAMKASEGSVFRRDCGRVLAQSDYLFDDYVPLNIERIQGCIEDGTMIVHGIYDREMGCFVDLDHMLERAPSYGVTEDAPEVGEVVGAEVREREVIEAQGEAKQLKRQLAAAQGEAEQLQGELAAAQGEAEQLKGELAAAVRGRRWARRGFGAAAVGIVGLAGAWVYEGDNAANRYVQDLLNDWGVAHVTGGQEKRNLRADLQRATAQVATLGTRLADVTEQRAVALYKLSDAESKIALLEAGNTSLQRQLSDALAEKSTAEADFGRAVAAIVEKDVRLADKEKELARVRGELERVMGVNETLRDLLDGQGDAGAQIAALERQIGELAAEKSALQDALDDERAVATELRQRIADMEEAFDTMRAELLSSFGSGMETLTQLLESSENLDGILAVLASQREMMERLVDAGNGRLAALLEQREGLQGQQLGDLLVQINGLARQVEELKDALDAAERVSEAAVPRVVINDHVTAILSQIIPMPNQERIDFVNRLNSDMLECDRIQLRLTPDQFRMLQNGGNLEEFYIGKTVEYGAERMDVNVRNGFSMTLDTPDKVDDFIQLLKAPGLVQIILQNTNPRVADQELVYHEGRFVDPKQVQGDRALECSR